MKCVNGKYTKSDGTCECYDGYKGDACEDIMRDAFIGTYNLNDQCNTNLFSSTISAMDNPDDEKAVNYVSVTNLTTLGDDSGYGIISGDSIYIPFQSVKTSGGQNYKVESIGGARINGGTFSLDIKRKYESFDITCNYTWSK